VKNVSPVDALRAPLDTLCRRVNRLRFSEPVTHVYNPLDYARAAFDQYLDKYAQRGVRALLIGMNPGPWGMAQTGVPFGAVSPVRDWLKIKATIGKPRTEHPKRPVEGLNCARDEVSGVRLWGWAQGHFGKPADFFRRFFVYNYCPLMFMEDSGRNRTPDKLPAEVKAPLLKACDEALRDVVGVMQPQYVIGVGTFAASRAAAALDGSTVTLGRILHPSPASPAANRDWAGTVERELKEMGIDLKRRKART